MTVCNFIILMEETCVHLMISKGTERKLDTVLFLVYEVAKGGMGSVFLKVVALNFVFLTKQLTG